MKVSTNTFIQKMKQEINSLSAENEIEIIQDKMSKIHVLSELWLEEYQQQDKKPVMNDQAEKKMVSPDQLTKASIDVGSVSDDTSIFDF